MIGNNLKNKRIEAGYSQREVAEFLQISFQSVSKWENDEALPSIAYLPQLARLLNCSIDDFFASNEQPKQGFYLMSIKAYFETRATTSKIDDTEKSNELWETLEKQYPNVFDQMDQLLHLLNKAHKAVKKKWLQALLPFTEEESEEALQLLMKEEMVESLDIDDLYIVHKNAVYTQWVALTICRNFKVKDDEEKAGEILDLIIKGMDSEGASED